MLFMSGLRFRQPEKEHAATIVRIELAVQKALEMPPEHSSLLSYERTLTCLSRGKCQAQMSDLTAKLSLNMSRLRNITKGFDIQRESHSTLIPRKMQRAPELSDSKPPLETTEISQK